jgi:hypothetical protein
MVSAIEINDSVGSDRASPPNIYVTKEAAGRIPWLNRIFSIEDPSLRYQALCSSLGLCQGVTSVKLNGTLVVGLENTSPGSREGRERVIMLRNLPKAQTAKSGHRFDGLAAAIGTNLGGERLERLMEMHGVNESRLLELIRIKRGIEYIALEYDVSRGIAERVHRAVDVTAGNPLHMDDLRKMDLTLCVHAAKSDRGAIDRYVA